MNELLLAVPLVTTLFHYGRFSLEDVRVFASRNSTGVRGIRLADGDEVKIGDHVWLGFGTYVLKGVSMQIRAGDRVAILGKIGSGKSTILRLLGGLYQPTEGLVQVDGIDLRQIDPADLKEFT